METKITRQEKELTTTPDAENTAILQGFAHQRREPRHQFWGQKKPKGKVDCKLK